MGAYGGSTVEERLIGKEIEGKLELSVASVAVADQYINMDQASKEQAVGGVSPGQNVFHESMGAYNAAKSHPGDIATGTSPAYLPAHNKAIASDPNWVSMVPRATQHTVGGLISVTYTTIIYNIRYQEML